MNTTKPNLETCTIQEACDYSVAMIVKQGVRCMKLAVKGERSQSFCVYGDKEGNHCAVGWLLDDTNEDLMSYEGDVEDLSKAGFGDLPSILNNNTDLFLILQSFHDSQTRGVRLYYKNRLIKFISTDAPQYQQWIEMGG